MFCFKGQHEKKILKQRYGRQVAPRTPEVMKPGFLEVTISYLLCHSTPDTHRPCLCLQSTHYCTQYFWLPPISLLFPKSYSYPTVPTRSYLIYGYWLTTMCMLIHQWAGTKQQMQLVSTGHCLFYIGTV